MDLLVGQGNRHREASSFSVARWSSQDRGPGGLTPGLSEARAVTRGELLFVGPGGLETCAGVAEGGL